jgi:hypothetical protein
MGSLGNSLRPALLAILLSAAATCFAALFLGQAALRLAGAREWNWLAPMVGLSLAMLVAIPTTHIPGRTATMAVLLGGLAVAAAVWCLRSPSHRPPLTDLLAALPVVALALVPFLAAGRGGVLGVTVNNDMTVHLAFVEGYLSPGVAELYALPRDYPLGPHALTALLSKGLGAEADLAFSGWTLAMVTINAWTVLATARRAPWFGKAVAATVAGMPFLVAAYYGQGSFKEVAQAGLVLATVLYLAGCGPRLGRGRWVPFALLVGGIVSAYSLAGLPWVLAIGGLWLVGLLAIQAWRRQLGEVPAIVRRELPALGIGLGVLLAALLPQAKRMYEFIALRDGTGIRVDDIGNLVTRLPGWEAQGIWDKADYRFLASESFVGGPWSWFVVALVLFGSFWAIRRGRWLLPLAALAALLIWEYSDGTQSIYVSAKALVIASPLLLLVAMQPLIDREEEPWPRRPRWLWLAVPLASLVFFVQVGISDLRALRFSPVGPTDHARQLMSLRPLIAGDRALVLGEDEFLIWELVGAQSRAAALGPTEQVPFRPEKEWEFAQAMDFDTFPAATLNEYEWIVAPRDAAASAPPPQLRLVHSTEAFDLWKRTGPVRERSTLREGQFPGAVFRCDSDEGRAIVERGGVAAVRRSPLVATGGSALAGGTISIRLDPPPGRWTLTAPYVSHLPLEVEAPGLRAELPASLDRIGPRWPVGRLTVRRQRPFQVSFHVEDTLLASPTATATIPYLVAVPVGDPDRIVSIERACGRYVDWYRSAR